MTQMIIANWKMNLSQKEAFDFCSKLNKLESMRDLILAPPMPYIALLANEFPKLQLCAQDVSVFNKYGPYTGEVSVEMLASCGVKYALIGHSERRTLHRETNKTVKRKVENCLRHGIAPIICIGEPIDSRQNNHHKDFLIEQLNESLPEDSNIDLDLKEIVIAYEPLWAIGAGIAPTSDEISEVSGWIKEYLESRDGGRQYLAKYIKIVYGGSVSVKNYKKIINQDKLSGIIVGSLALDFEGLQALVDAAVKEDYS